MRPQIVKTLTSVLLCMFTSTMMLAQLSRSDSGPPTPTPERTPQLPLDGGIAILIALALVYGSYVAYKKVCAKAKTA